MNLGDSYRDERNTVLGAIPNVGTISANSSVGFRALG